MKAPASALATGPTERADAPAAMLHLRSARLWRPALQTATDCLDIRLKAGQKSLLTGAAEMEGVMLDQCMRAPMLKRALELIAEVEQVTSTAARADVLDILANPPKPNKAFIAAMREYEVESQSRRSSMPRKETPATLTNATAFAQSPFAR